MECADTHGSVKSSSTSHREARRGSMFTLTRKFYSAVFCPKWLLVLLMLLTLMSKTLHQPIIDLSSLVLGEYDIMMLSRTLTPPDTLFLTFGILHVSDCPLILPKLNHSWSVSLISCHSFPLYLMYTIWFSNSCCHFSGGRLHGQSRACGPHG